MPYDLARLDCIKQNQEAGVDVPVHHPVTGEPIGLTLKVRGFKSSAVQAAVARDTAEVKGRRTAMSVEETERRTRQIAAALIAGWTFDEGVTLGGRVPECTPAEVEALFERCPFIMELADRAAGNVATFYKAEA